jgi:hypothetical protein
MHAVAVVFDLVEPLDRRPAPHRPAGRVVAKSTPAKPAVSDPRATDCAMPEAGTGYCGGACASLVLGKVRGSAVAEGSEFRQQVCQAVSRLVAQPANRLGNV